MNIEGTPNIGKRVRKPAQTAAAFANAQYAAEEARKAALVAKKAAKLTTAAEDKELARLMGQMGMGAPAVSGWGGAPASFGGAPAGWGAAGAAAPPSAGVFGSSLFGTPGFGAQALPQASWGAGLPSSMPIMGASAAAGGGGGGGGAAAMNMGNSQGGGYRRRKSHRKHRKSHRKSHKGRKHRRTHRR